MKIAGIRRNVEFSPNHRNNDYTIFMLAAEKLEVMGCSVVHYTEEDVLKLDKIEEEQIFTMARSKDVIKKLQQWEQGGKLIVNSAKGIELCYRTNMTKQLLGQHIPYPKSIIISTEHATVADFYQLAQDNFWIKRGDFHAIHKEDVTFVKTAAEGVEMMKEYALRGIAEAVVSVHLYGDLIKFYGVADTGFFHWFYPGDMHSKFANEKINGAAKQFSFDVKQLQALAAKAAAALSIGIYGGDVIIDEAGNMQIIDLNDWPSFAPCREEAATAIAEHIYKTVQTFHEQQQPA